MFEDDDDRQYVVVRNHEEQYSIWPDDRPVPAGWEEAGPRGLKQDCISFIDQVWTDMRPKSLRDAMAHDATAREATAREATARDATAHEAG